MNVSTAALHRSLSLISFVVYSHTHTILKHSRDIRKETHVLYKRTIALYEQSQKCTTDPISLSTTFAWNSSSRLLSTLFVRMVHCCGCDGCVHCPSTAAMCLGITRRVCTRYTGCAAAQCVAVCSATCRCKGDA